MYDIILLVKENGNGLLSFVFAIRSLLGGWEMFVRNVHFFFWCEREILVTFVEMF